MAKDLKFHKASAGFTYVEVIMVLTLLAIIGAVGVGIVSDNVDAGRFEKTRVQMEALKRIILGDTTLSDQGRRTNFGYVGDWGSLPTVLSNLIISQTPAWTFSTAYGVGAGWRGPYARTNVQGLSEIKDAWNRDFVWDPTGPPPTLKSLGADGVVGGALYNADLVVELPTTQWRAKVNGRVLNGSTGLSGRTVEIRYPVAGVLTAASPATTDANGGFSFSSVPFGVRSLAVTSSPALAARQVVVDSYEFQVANDVLNFESAPVNLNAYCCRLSLSSTDAVPSSDLTSKTTIYLVPYGGNNIALYDGSEWKNYTLNSAISLVATGTANTNYDVYVYDNNGTLTLETAAWTTSTAGFGGGGRATALAYQDGVPVKTGATTRRYLGTIRTDSSGNLEDSAARRFVWNYFHRFRRPLKKKETTVSWTYNPATPTWRPANGNTANRVEYVTGTHTPVSVTVTVHAINSSSATYWVGIGENTTTDSTADKDGSEYGCSGCGSKILEAATNKIAIDGYNYFQWVEDSQATITTTFYSDGQAGISGYIEG